VFGKASLARCIEGPRCPKIAAEIHDLSRWIRHGIVDRDLALLVLDCNGSARWRVWRKRRWREATTGHQRHAVSQDDDGDVDRDESPRVGRSLTDFNWTGIAHGVFPAAARSTHAAAPT